MLRKRHIINNKPIRIRIRGGVRQLICKLRETNLFIENRVFYSCIIVGYAARSAVKEGTRKPLFPSAGYEFVILIL